MRIHSPESFHVLSSESHSPLYDSQIEPLVSALAGAESNVLKGSNIFNYPRAIDCKSRHYNGRHKLDNAINCTVYPLSTNLSLRRVNDIDINEDDKTYGMPGGDDDIDNIDSNLETESHPFFVLKTELQNAKQSILMCVTYFTDWDILKILEKKGKENEKIKIQIMISQDCIEYKRYAKIINSLIAIPNIQVKVVYGGSHYECEDSKDSGMFHLKTIIIDSNIVLDGSYDATYDAKRNNIEWHYLFESNELSCQRTKDFQREWNSSQAYWVTPVKKTNNQFQFDITRKTSN